MGEKRKNIDAPQSKTNSRHKMCGDNVREVGGVSSALDTLKIASFKATEAAETLGG